MEIEQYSVFAFIYYGILIATSLYFYLLIKRDNKDINHGGKKPLMIFEDGTEIHL